MVCGDAGEHPLPELIAEGLYVTLNSDDPPMLNTALTDEYFKVVEHFGFNIKDMKGGLSDHTGTIYSGLAAAALGAEVLEVHVTMSRYAFGPDVSSSITMPIKMWGRASGRPAGRLARSLSR